MAPFTVDDCPVCSAQTRQHFLDVADGAVTTICYDCATVLITGEGGLLGQRPGTEEERSLIPERYQPSEEELALWREDVRQGMRDVQAWIEKGCPGAPAEWDRTLPRFLEAFEKMREQFPPAD